MSPSVVSWATGYMIVHGEEGAGWRDARLTGQAVPEKLPRDLLFWVHIWRRTTKCLTASLLTHHAATRNSRRSPFLQPRPSSTLYRESLTSSTLSRKDA